jgi:predicted DsbA family dithiol-disulfide isomerase
LKFLLKEACSECEVVERRYSEAERDKAAQTYEIKAVPTVVVDGKIAIVGKPTLEQVKRLFT